MTQTLRVLAAITLLAIPTQQFCLKPIDSATVLRDAEDNVKVAQASKAASQNRKVQAQLAFDAAQNSYNDLTNRGPRADDSQPGMSPDAVYQEKCSKAWKILKEKEKELAAAKKELAQEEATYNRALANKAKLETDIARNCAKEEQARRETDRLAREEADRLARAEAARLAAQAAAVQRDARIAAAEIIVLSNMDDINRLNPTAAQRINRTLANRYGQENEAGWFFGFKWN